MIVQCQYVDVRREKNERKKKSKNQIAAAATKNKCQLE